MLTESSVRSRVLATLIEPLAASVFFSPEVHEGFHRLGFGPSTGQVSGDPWLEMHWGECQMPDYTAYFASRGAFLGDVPGEVVAAVFGIFEPQAVLAAVAAGKRTASREDILAARDAGAIAQLERILGERPDGVDLVDDALERAGSRLELAARPMYAGLTALQVPAQPLGRAWRLAERLREFRGDAFRCAWSAAGLSGCQIQLLTEMIAGFPRHIYTAGRVWSEEQMNAAEAVLTERGLVADGQPTDAGRALREDIERAVDTACLPMVEDVGDDFVALATVLTGWFDTIVAGRGHAPAMPQEQTMPLQVQDWMEAHGLRRFAWGPQVSAPVNG